jgi:hypothetical protein
MIFFLPLLLPVSVSADYFRYVDEKGVFRYVDIMSKVPEAYRDQAVYHKTSSDSNKDTSVQGPMGALLKQQMKLDEEYSDLMKEKEALLKSIREWEQKYQVWENKRSALDKIMQ